MSSNDNKPESKKTLLEWASEKKKTLIGGLVVLLVAALAVAADLSQVTGCTIMNMINNRSCNIVVVESNDQTVSDGSTASEEIAEENKSNNYFDPHKKYSRGDIFTFGKTEQDNNLNNGSEYIEWRVLDAEAGSLLVVAEKGLAYRRMNDVYSKTWEVCELRSWLGIEFYNDCFTDEEKQVVRVVNNSNKDYPGNNTDSGRNTTDTFFVLSAFEVEEYMPTLADRLCVPTAYAFARGEGVDHVGAKGDTWWTRTVGSNDDCMMNVKRDGTVNSRGIMMTDKSMLVRPAVYLSGNLED